jgi:hypothetical protein
MGKSREIREKSQLTLEWTETMRWRDVPPAVQERLRVLLRALLSAAAAPRTPAEEAAADECH